MTSSPASRRRRRLSGRWVAAGVALLAVALIAAALLRNGNRAPVSSLGTIVAVERGNIVASVAGSGTIAAEQTLELPFQTGGTVTEVLVQEGDVVRKGQVLAQLDARELELQLEEARVGLLSAEASLLAAQAGDATPEQIAAAEATLRNAEATLEQVRSGNITPADIAASEAGIRQAEAQLQQVRTGNVTAADISSAEAVLASAQARLAQLRAGPDAGALSSAQAQVEQARAELTQIQAPPSGEQVIQAEADLRNAEAAVQRAQAAFDRVAWRPDISGTPESLELQQATNNLDAARARYAEVTRGADPADVASAQARLRDAEEQLRIVQQGASQAEIVEGQAAVTQAQATLNNLRSGGSAAEIAASQASVDQARANLQALTEGGTEADVAASQANVDQARANLQALTAPSSETEVAIQRASVAQAEQAIRRAELVLEQATLIAPFAGIVAQVDIVPGSIVQAGSPILTLIDRSLLHVDLRLSENDVARVELGQPVTLTIDPLRDRTAQGEVTFIAPAAEVTNDVVTYAVRVSFSDDDPAIKVGMTANLDIVTAEKEEVLLVPTSALLPKGAGYVVQVPDASSGTPSEVEVETGLTDGAMTEIVSGLQAGQRVFAVPLDPNQAPPSSPFGN